MGRKHKKPNICRLVNYTEWPLGHVIETYHEKNGIVRAGKVKTTNNELIRLSGKLVLLENNY